MLKFIISVLAAVSVGLSQGSTDSAQSPDQQKPKSQATNTVAVLTLKNAAGISASEAGLITDRLNVELFKTGMVTLLEREQINDILKEQGFQNSGACSDEACLVEMGQVLGVRSVIAGSIGSLGTLTMLNVRIIDVRTGRVEKVVSQDIPGRIEDVITVMPGIARKLVGLDTSSANIQVSSGGVVQQKAAVDTSTPQIHPANNAAMLVVKTVPDGFSVQLNGREEGKTPFTNAQLLPGRYSLKLSSPKYDDYIESFDLNAGVTKKIETTMTHKYGVVIVKTNPQGASLKFDDANVGTTPWTSDSVYPGEHSLYLTMKDCRPVSAKINVIKGKLDTEAYILYNSAAVDSINKANRKDAAPRRWARRIVFGTLAAGALGTGIYFNSRVKSDNSSASDALTKYNKSGLSTSQYSMYYSDYQNSHDSAKKNTVFRNILYGVAGGFGFFFCLSIPF